MSIFVGRGATFSTAAAATRAGIAALRSKAPGGPTRWERKNFAGRTVELYAGPAAALGAALGAARVRPAAGFAVVAAGVCGAYDDAVGVDDPRRGFRAHLGALRDGDVSGHAANPNVASLTAPLDQGDEQQLPGPRVPKRIVFANRRCAGALSSSPAARHRHP